MNKPCAVVLSASVAAISTASLATAEVFQLFGSQTTDTSGITWGLVRFNTNPIDGTSTRIGRGGLMYDFDFDASGVLYSSRGGSLWVVDTATGVQAQVGSFGVAPTISALAFSPGGVLYGTDNLGSNTSLYTIDTQTGQAQRVGLVGDHVSGLDFAPDGRLLGAAGDVFLIDTHTGIKSDVVVPYAGAYITGLDYGADGVLRGLASNYIGVHSALLQIDLDTGIASLIGQTTDASMVGLASVPSPQPVVLAGLLAIRGLGGRRRNVP